MSRLLVTTVLAFAVTFAPAAQSPAATLPPCAVPDGTGAVDQYCEEIPTADGMGEQTDGLGGSRSGSGMRSVPLREILSRRAVEALVQAGALGRALLRVPVETPAGGVSATRPAVSRPTGSTDPADLPRPARDPVQALGQSAEASVLSGDFRWVLSASTVALFAAAWWRLRRTHAY